MRVVLPILIFSTISTGIISCQEIDSKKKNNSTNAMKKYEWRVTECAPKLYPIEVVRGKLTSSADKVSTSVPKGATINTGWGEFGSLWITGEKLKSVPDKLEITWLSYAEKKFYTGKFDLPKQKITALFEKGTIDETGRQEPYNIIKVGLAPKGIVAVWLSGVGASEEIGYYQAAETKLTMEEFHPGGVETLEEYFSLTTEDFSPEVKESITTEVNEDIKERYNDYRQRYSWRSKLVLADSGSFNEIYIKYYNGEHLHTISSNPVLESSESRAIPKYIGPVWSDKNGLKYKADIFTNEKEVFDAFNTLHKDTDSLECQLVIEVDKYNSTLKIYLGTDSNSIALKKSKVKVYPND